jgi:ribosomal protein S18 acetylase RimI-like enzyme
VSAPDRIEPAGPGDAAELARLINLDYRVEDSFKRVDRTTVDEVGAYLEHEAFLVAREAGGGIIGAVRVAHRPPDGHVGMLSVRPDAQGRGIGRRLIEAAEALCREAGCATVSLEIASPRTELPPLYERLGYRRVGASPWPAEAWHELKHPAHFIVMSKSLNERPPEDQHG